MAHRSYVHRKAERAKAMENPNMRRQIEATAGWFAKLAGEVRRGAPTRSGWIKALNLEDSGSAGGPWQGRL
jgi:hypothetical protein